MVNAGKLVNMQIDYDLYESVIQSDIINADGQSIVWASKFLDTPLPERVAGIDLMESLVELAHNNGYSCYFLGAKQEVVQKVVDPTSFQPKIGFMTRYALVENLFGAENYYRRFLVDFTGSSLAGPSLW